MLQVSAADDLRFMQLALALGRRGLGNTWPNPAVGAVIVKDGIVIGRGWTKPGGRPHAETEALRQAGAAAKGATLYVTLEPCSHHGKTPPCADAIVAAGVARVVSAIEDPNSQVAGRGHDILRAAGVAVTIGVCDDEARKAHAGHIRRILDGRPHVTLKLAVSADGKAALAGRKPVQITGEETRARVHLMRAMNDAILVGIGTVLADDPALTCRLPGMHGQSPVRVVLDRDLQIPMSSALVVSANDIPVWLFCGENASPASERLLREKGVTVFRVSLNGHHLDLSAVLQNLAHEGITRLMVEGGPRVAASFIGADLVDEAVLLRGPVTVGMDGIDALDGLPLDALTSSAHLRLTGTETIGADTLSHFERFHD
jgi:diaminohydroxyphosphoribosylaminopyrimidine deaminase/5-amino-6-(5-phosphoribosylamino)uracil reductase